MEPNSTAASDAEIRNALADSDTARRIQDDEGKRAQDENHEIYEYDNDSYTKVNEDLRYTHGDDGIMAGGPWASVGQRVDATLVADDSQVLTFVTNKAGRQFQDISRSLTTPMCFKWMPLRHRGRVPGRGRYSG